MINVLELLTDPEFITGKILITRFEATVNAKGRREETTVTTEVAAIAQPATAKELERLPESSRVNETLAVWTLNHLEEGDAFKRSGEETLFSVVSVEQWDGFSKALACRKDLS